MHQPSRKRQRTSGGGDEPGVEIDVEPSTATVLIDEEQTAIFDQVFPYRMFPGTIRGIPPHQYKYIFFDGNSLETSIQTGNSTENSETSYEGNVQAYTSYINAMSGCRQTAYHGKFSVGGEWDTHRGNSLISLRVFIEPTVGGADKYYIKDYWMILPPGEIFDSADYTSEAENACYLIDYCIGTKLNLSRTGDWRSEIMGDLKRTADSTPNAGSVVWMDQTNLTDNIYLFSCRFNRSTQQYSIKMNNQALAANYKGSISTFAIFDHPNSMMNRGWHWSGFGYLNKNYSAGVEPFVAEESAAFPYTVYPFVFPSDGSGEPLFGELLLRDYLEDSFFKDVETGEVTAGNYHLQRAYIMETKLGFAHDAQMNYGGVNTYTACRSPALKDCRYIIYTSEELCFDQKAIPFQNVGIYSNIPSQTFGVYLNSFNDGEKNNLKQGFNFPGRGKKYREDGWVGVHYNPIISLAKNTSVQKVSIQTKNDHGELIKPSLLSTMPFFPQVRHANDTTLYTIGGGIPPYAPAYIPSNTPRLNFAENYFGRFGHSTHSANLYNMLPYFAFFDNKLKHLQGPTVFHTVDLCKKTIMHDLKWYIDDKVRISSGDRPVHFLQNNIY